MLKAGTQTTKWPKMKPEQVVSPSSSGSHQAGSDDSDNNEDKIPVPEFHRSFGSAIEAALTSIDSKQGIDTKSINPLSLEKSPPVLESS